MASIFLSNVLWIYQSTLIAESSILSMEQYGIQLQSSLKPLKPSEKFQVFVISLRRDNVEHFLTRNRASFPATNISVTWFPSSNGFDQAVLDEYASLTGFPPLNASAHHLGGYSTPHHTGCFMSHWNLLRLAKAGWEALLSTPRALVVLEEDATCANSILPAVHKLLPLLPVDWDMLYVGGKPFSYYTLDPLRTDLKQKKNIQKDFTRQEFRTIACQGGFGRTATGPFAPDGGRGLSITQPYWQTHYITNTHAYIVNPQRIHRLLHVLEHSLRDYQVPVDIAFAEAAQNGILKIFMSTMEFCVQQAIGQQNKRQRTQPSAWQGLYYHRDLAGRRVDEMLFSECPTKP